MLYSKNALLAKRMITTVKAEPKPLRGIKSAS